MKDSFSNMSRCVSIFDRLMKMYYDRGLSDFEIGWGQQFYVEYLFEHPGASAQEMTERFRVDKATLTKVMKKLQQVGYLRTEEDPQDRRVRHLYLTEKAIPAARQIKRIHAEFYDTFSQGIRPEEMEQTERLLMRMADNIHQKVRHRMEEHNGK